MNIYKFAYFLKKYYPQVERLGDFCVYTFGYKGTKQYNKNKYR